MIKLILLLRLVSKQFHERCQLHNNTKHLLNLATRPIESFFLYNISLSGFRSVKEQRGAAGWRACIRKLYEVSFLSCLKAKKKKKRIEHFFEKQEREVPQRQCCSQWKFFISQPNHSKPQNVVIVMCSVVMNCSTSLLGFRHFPYQSRSSQKVFLAKTSSFSTGRSCLHIVLDLPPQTHF